MPLFIVIQPDRFYWGGLHSYKMIAFCKKSSVHKVWCFSILKK